ncbi:MAG: hypothetical protein KBA66_02035 [Leptospiraceae bacterium]|nr:hypothetical protein [Leptospiraceae bacterium]
MPENNSTIDINEVMKHYLLCAIWTEEEQMSEMEEKEIADFYGESEEITKLVPRNEMNIENFSDDSKIKAFEDIRKFLSIDGVQEAIEKQNIPNDMLGHDLWLTRNSHGAGFWDRGYDKKISNLLTNAALSLGRCEVEAGDEGWLHLR